MKSEETLEIESALRTWMPTELSGLKLNTLRDSVRCSEVTVNNSNIKGGIVDFMRFEEYYTIEGEKRLCYLNWRAKADYCEKGLGKGERRKYCDQTSCGFNYAVDIEVNHYLHTAIEIKVTLADFKSNHGHNFVGNLNYYAIPGYLLPEVEDLVPEDIGIILYQDGILTEHKKASYHELTLEEQLERTVCILKASRCGRNQEHNKTVYQYRRKAKRFNRR